MKIAPYGISISQSRQASPPAGKPSLGCTEGEVPSPTESYLANSSSSTHTWSEAPYTQTEVATTGCAPGRLKQHRWTAVGTLTGLAVGTAVGASLTSGSLGPALAWGAGLGAAAGKVADLYSVPDTLYHFTSSDAAEAISESGRLEPKPGNHGVGVYTTRFPSRSVAALQRAASTDMVFAIESETYAVKPTAVPGTFVITEAVAVDAEQVELSRAGDSKLADWLHDFNWREKVNLLRPKR